jgi:hypothetical protein
VYRFGQLVLDVREERCRKEALDSAAINRQDLEFIHWPFFSEVAHGLRAFHSRCEERASNAWALTVKDQTYLILRRLNQVRLAIFRSLAILLLKKHLPSLLPQSQGHGALFANFFFIPSS